jgi:glycosyltransferase involved in cell wall biosynthesis
MKVALVNTYAHGGAGIACRRLQTALQTQGLETAILYRDTHGSKWPFYAERLSFLPYEHDKSVRFSYSLANFGTDISQHPDIKSADIIHLHWINQGFLSLKNIQQLAATGKPIFWTLHDMWAFTGGCHYARGCTHYLQSCGNCPYLRAPNENDLSNRIWKRKQSYFPPNIHFITCSEWLAQEARNSGLLRNFHIQSIPNPIDTAIFAPITQAQRISIRTQLGISPAAHLLLFVAMKVSEERKGFKYLLEALQYLKKEYPNQVYEVLVLGKADAAAIDQLPYPTHTLGMVTDIVALSQWYAVADVFIIPSLEDNLPNTVMESLACGTPVVGFQTGGIPEMVDDAQNGYIVPQRDSAGLGKSIFQVLSSHDRMAAFRTAAREKVLRAYTLDVISKRYLDAYQKAL